MKFADLPIGTTFDFVRPGGVHNTFFEACKKIGRKRYVTLDTGFELELENPMAMVYHVAGAVDALDC